MSLDQLRPFLASLSSQIVYLSSYSYSLPCYVRSTAVQCLSRFTNAAANSALLTHCQYSAVAPCLRYREFSGVCDLYRTCLSNIELTGRYVSLEHWSWFLQSLLLYIVFNPFSADPVKALSY